MTAVSARVLEILAFPSPDYETVWQLQKELVEKRFQDTMLDTLLIGEHDHVITCGRGTHIENIFNPDNIPVVEVERGGDVTYHGPGQLVCYPIIKLEEHKRDLHGYLRNLEEAVIQTLAEFDIEASRKPGWTGVWVGEKKICSVGVAVKKWVTYHGFALNINPDLAMFSAINPCGLPSETMTSMAALTNKTITKTSVQAVLVKQLMQICV
jgi:lipoate-protein ligase B